MVINRLLAGLMLATGSLFATAQINHVNRLPEVDGKAQQYNEYTDNHTGFWIAGEASTAYSCRLFNSNFGYTELNAVGGYRFNDYLRLGIGIGARYYFDNNKVRTDLSEWAFPVFFNIRGNFIPSNYRNVVPYYSLDVGGTIRDGFMVRPTVGLRVGRERSAFLVGLGYVGQNLTTWQVSDARAGENTKFVSFITLKLGYEF